MNGAAVSCVGAGAVLLAVALDAHRGVIAGLVLVFAGLASLVFAFNSRARRRRLSSIERAAHQLLMPGEPPEAQRTQIDHDDIPPTDILRPLADSIGRLGHRMDKQFKEVAKHTSNLRAVIDALDEPIIATGDEDRVLLCNRSAEALFDVGPDGLTDRPIREALTHVSLLDMHREAKGGATRRGKSKLTTSLGIRTFQVSACPVPAAWGEGIFGVVLLLRDVTELDEAVRVKSDFVANASHELRTPVAAIKAAAETLCMHGESDPKRLQRLAQIIDQHAGRLDELVRDLLDLSRIESADVTLRIDTIDAEELEVKLHQQFDPACVRRRLRLAFDLDDRLKVFKSDERLIHLCVRNLIENATRFAYEGTEVKVASSVATNDDVEGAPVGDEVTVTARFEVTDNGPGIPIEHQQRVFERFFQAEPARRDDAGHRGTGLGLAIVKHAANALGGRVGLESTWGEGTRIWFEVPVTIRAAG